MFKNILAFLILVVGCVIAAVSFSALVIIAAVLFVLTVVGALIKHRGFGGLHQEVRTLAIKNHPEHEFKLTTGVWVAAYTFSVIILMIGCLAWPLVAPLALIYEKPSK